jgi:hypothetical protein
MHQKKRNKEFPKNPHPSLNSPHSGMPQEKKTFRLMFLPFLKVVKKTPTRWSQVTKK